MRLGVIAMEFPPQRGGMQEHAHGVVKHLSRRHEVILFTGLGRGVALPNVTIVDRLDGTIPGDVALLRQYRPDVWLAMSAGLASYSPFLDAPFFAYVHGNDFLKPWRPSLPRPLRRLRLLGGKLPHLLPLIAHAEIMWRCRKIHAGLRQAALIFANSRYTRQRCCDMFSIDLPRVVVVPPGITDSHFATADRDFHVHMDGSLKVLTVSRLSKANPRKNVESVIKAIALLEGDLDIHYTVVGTGDDLPRHQELVEHLRLSSRVRFTGGVGDDELRELYRWADVFILAIRPSALDVEGFGMVYVEAAAHGLPVIAVNCGGIVDVVKPETGLLLEEPTPQAIAHGLRTFQARQTEFRPGVIRRVAKEFSAESTSERLIEWIEATCQ